MQEGSSISLAMASTPIPVSTLSNEELFRLSKDELLQLLRTTDKERMSVMKEHAQLMKDFNQRMQVHLVEIRSLKEVNQRLQGDNQELQGLCCFLDDERKKERQLAKEWQRFGRYTSGVMKSEVDTSQQKLNELELRQEELLKENDELKLLCLNLEQERLESTVDRDQGDGSSNSSSTADKQVNHDDSLLTPPPSQRPTREHFFQGEPINRHFSKEHEQNMQYIRQLEERILRYEEEKKLKLQRQSRERSKSPGRSEGRRYFVSPDLPNHGVVSATMRERSCSPGGHTATNPHRIPEPVKPLDIKSRGDHPHHPAAGLGSIHAPMNGPLPAELIRDGCSISLV